MNFVNIKGWFNAISKHPVAGTIVLAIALLGLLSFDFVRAAVGELGKNWVTSSGTSPVEAGNTDPMRASLRYYDDFQVIIPSSEFASGRNYLGLSPEEMKKSLKGLTSQQASLQAENMFGNKWLRIRGVIEDILGSDSFATVVMRPDGITTRFDMAPGNISQVSHLAKGDVVVVEGMFDSIDYAGPDFIQSVIVKTAVSGSAN